MQEMERQFSRSIRDIIVIGIVLGVLNWLIARGDFGWLALNPTPWLLMPALLGVRYGLASGLIAGITAALSIAVVQGNAAGVSAHVFTQQHPFFFTVLVFTGFIAGEIHRQTGGRSRELAASTKRLIDQVERMSAELELARETRQELQRHLALHRATTASLDDDIRKLLTNSPAQMMDGLLGVLHQHAQITSAAIYRRDGMKLRRQATLHPTRLLAETLHLDEVPLASKALTERTIASITSPMDTTTGQPFLVVIPWEDSDGSGVLIVQDMPLQSFDWEHLATMHLILNWTISLSRYRRDLHDSAGGPKPVDTEDFMLLVGQALDAERIHHLPSVIVRADFQQAEEAKSSKVQRLLLKALPPTAVTYRLPDDGSLMVLLPFGGETEAQTLTKELVKLGPSLRMSHYVVVGPVQLESFWEHVTQP